MSGSGAFRKWMKEKGNRLWTYRKCECWHE